MRQSRNSNLANSFVCEPLEGRRLLTGTQSSVTPEILLSGPNGTETEIDGTSITWPAGIALNVRAVDTINLTTAPFAPSSTGSTFAANTNANPDNTRFAWNFGDATSAGVTNKLIGFNAAHVYDTASTTPYVLTLTTTDLNGVSVSVTVSVTVTTGTVSNVNGISLPAGGIGSSAADPVSNPAPGGRIIYVDNAVTLGDGSSPSSPVNTFAQAFTAYQSAETTNTPVTQIRFKQGEKFPVMSNIETEGMKLTNLIIGAYGSGGSDPVIDDDDTAIKTLLYPTVSSANLTIQDLCFEASVTNSPSCAPTLFWPAGTDLTMRRCEFDDVADDNPNGHFNSLIYDQSSSAISLDGLLLDGNNDLGESIPSYEIGLFGWDDDVVITGNTLGGGSPAQDMFRINNGPPDSDARILVEDNTLDPPTSAWQDNALDFRGQGYYDFIYGNTIYGLAGEGNGGTHSQTGYNFKWMVFESNRVIDGRLTFSADEYHVTFSNNVFERYSNVADAKYAISNAAEGATVDSTTAYGAEDVEVLSNTLYVDAAGLNGNTETNQEFIDLTGAATNSSGVDVGTTQDAVVVDNLMVDRNAFFGSSYPAVGLYSSQQLAADYSNVYSFDSNGMSSVKGGGYVYYTNGNSTGYSVSAWNTTVRESVNTNATTYNSPEYDETLLYDDPSLSNHAQSLTIENDTSRSAVPAQAAYPDYSVVSASTPPPATSYPGDEFDFYGNLRPSTGVWTTGAVQAGGATVPAAPSGLTVVADSHSDANLSWASNSTNQTGFEVLRSTNGGPYTLLNTTAANLTTYTDAPLTAGASYSYEVEAINAAGASAPAAAAAITAPLAGTVIGTAGSYNNISADTDASAYDGNLSSFFDGPDNTGDWAGLDLGAAYTITSIAYAPRANFATRMVGGVFQGSNTADFSSGVSTLSTVTAAPTAGQLTTVSLSGAGAYRYVRYLGSTSGGDADVAEVQFFGTPPAATLPSPWVDADIGTVGVAGSATYASATSAFTVNGGGANIYGTADAFNYAYQGLAGNGSIVAEVDNITDTGAYARGGVMIRGSTAAGAQEVDVVINANGTAQVEYRSTVGGSTTAITDSGYAAPQWVELARAGNVFTGFVSSNGTTWTQIGSVTVAMPTPALAGLAVNAYDNTQLATGTFTNVSVTATLPSPWVDADIGTVGVAGSATYASATSAFTVNGGGANIYGTADAFNYAYQGLAGNGSIVAEVDNITDTGAYARGGVMIRGSTAAGAQEVDVVINANGTAQVEYRSTVGGSTTAITDSGYAAPQWVELARAGNVFTGFVSSNGTTWTQIGSVTVAMPTPALAGLAVNAYDNTQLATGTFTNVSVTAGQLTGTTFGTSGSYNNQGNTVAMATDGNLSTFFDGPDASNDYVGIDLGATETISSIAFAPRSGFASRMVNGYFQAANSLTPGTATTIYTITATPASGSLTTIQFSSPIVDRYFSYVGPTGAYCDIAEFQLFGSTPTPTPLILNSQTTNDVIYLWSRMPTVRI